MTGAIAPGDCLGRKLLIVGDVNTGKTTLARRILEDLCARGLGPRIAVLDLAPHIPPELAAQRGLRGIGGTIGVPPGCGVLAVHEQLAPPRLTSNTEIEAQEKAAANKGLIDAAWVRLEPGTRTILFLNDVSMYLQAGTAAELIARLAPADTVIANGYFGERLGGGELTRHERAQLELLRDWFERTGSVLTLTTRF
ncbi:MAG TPA: hypothetical protein VKD22_06335 [Ramlibacter sp.]|nr:hypothetical protein [Ramlibacter sp.]